MNEEALAHWGLSRQKQKTKNTNLNNEVVALGSIWSVVAEKKKTTRGFKVVK